MICHSPSTIVLYHSHYMYENMESEKKIEQFWRCAIADDIAKVMRGEKIIARFRNSDKAKWSDEECFLAGYDASNYDNNWISHQGWGYVQCQVYDPPEWFINRPEPGDGWRLLKKFPPEALQATDEVWNDTHKDLFGGRWETPAFKKTQCETLWYRRRIEHNTSENSLAIPFRAYPGLEIILPNGRLLKITQTGFEAL